MKNVVIYWVACLLTCHFSFGQDGILESNSRPESLLAAACPEPVSWKIGTTSTSWPIVYDGYGNISYDSSRGIVMAPSVSGFPDETNAALVLSKLTKGYPVRDFIATIRVSTEKQLRVNSPPNPWEVFWVFFNYTTTLTGTKKTNYFVFKPNGVEFGRAYAEIGQDYLATDSKPQLEIGRIYTIVVKKSGLTLEAFIDGKSVLKYVGGSGRLSPYDVPGAIGLYTEDARVHIYSVNISPLTSE